MSEAPPPTTLEDAMFAELAELDLTLARHVHAQAMATTDPDALNGLARSYQRVARSLRQTLGLKAKLAADRAKAEAARPAAPPPHLDDATTAEDRIEGRILDLQEYVGRVIAAAHRRDPERQEELLERLDACLDDESEAWDFGLQPLDAHVRTLSARLDLPEEIAVRWRDLPLAPWTVIPDDDDDREIAPDPRHTAHDTG